MRWLAIAALLVSGCNQSPSVGDDVYQDAMLNLLKERIDTLEDRLAETRNHSVARLAPSDTGYSYLTTEIGAVAVQIEDVKPYADGSRVTGSLPAGAWHNVTVDLGVVPPSKLGLVTLDFASVERLNLYRK